MRTAEHPRRLTGHFAGKSTVDISYSQLPENKLPGFAKHAQIGGKIPTTDIAVITDQRHQLRDAGAQILSETTGGNITNIVTRMSRLAPGDWTLETWVGTNTVGQLDRYGRIIQNELHDNGIIANLITIPEGVTPHGLIVPRLTPDGKKDRTIFSFQPPNMSSEFAFDVPQSTEFAFVNSMSGPDWPKNLVAGTQRLKDREVRYAYAPGSTQMDAFEKPDTPNRLVKINAVYDAIDGAEILSVNMDELKLLLQGKNLVVKGKHPTELLPLAKEVLNAKTLFVTDGKEGAYAMGAENVMLRATMAPNIREVKSTLGAGDAFIAAAALRYFETGGDIKDSLAWGSVSGAMATEELGAHDNAPTRKQLETRLSDYGPDVYPVGQAIFAGSR